MRKSFKAVVKAAHATRRDNLLSLVGEGCRFPTQVELASKLDIDTSYLSQMVGPKPRRRITETTARKFEYKLGLRTGALDAAV